MPDDHSEVVPLLPIPNRTVKRFCADDSADSRVKVGHCQAIKVKSARFNDRALFFRLHQLRMHCPKQSAILANPRLAFIPVSVPHPPRHSEREDKRGFLQKLAEFLHPGPDSKDELIQTLAEAEDNEVINAESRQMLEGVIRMTDMTAGDAMVASTRMDLIDIDAAYETILHQVIDTAHSRFPVYERGRENIIGILMAKDLLKLQRAPEFNLRALLRPAVFVPESKGLNDLLRDFRGNRNHLAIVIDEFGRVAGIITIEDVLEQIVGEIEDEFDIAQDEGDIFGLPDRSYRVSGDTSIDRVSEAFGVQLIGKDNDEEFDTIGGLVAHDMGHVPRRGERHEMAGLNFTVMHTRGGAVKWFKVSATREGDTKQSL